METTLDKLIERASSKIANVSDNDLGSKEFAQYVYDKTKIDVPSLDTKKIKWVLDKETINSHNAPLNTEYYNGQVMEYALYEIPIAGDKDLFHKLINHSRWNRSQYVENDTYYYKEHSAEGIIEKQEVQNAIKNNLKFHVDKLNVELNQYKEKIDPLNESLQKSIGPLVEAEKKRRSDAKDANQNLNPFG